MKFFADTASLDEIEYCFSNHVNDGITTNPKILESTGDLSLGFEQACKAILQRYPNVPVSLETDLREVELDQTENKTRDVRDSILKQARKIASWQKNAVIKIPICWGGILATEILSEENIKTNVTACMTPHQALEAAKVGATYVSLFANRMLDYHILELAGYDIKETLQKPIWKDFVSNNKDKYFEEAWQITLDEIAYVAEKLDNKPTDLIIGSIRSPEDILRLIKASPQAITIPTKIVKGLEENKEDILKLKSTQRTINPKYVRPGNSICHPMTSYTLEEFEDSAAKYRNN